MNPLRELSHPNVCGFVGCILDPSFSALLYTFCPRGSLHDVLTTSTVSLNWIFKLSFAVDAASGMSYLHSKKIIHGRLSSEKCVLDEQWTLKVTGTLAAS